MTQESEVADKVRELLGPLTDDQRREVVGGMVREAAPTGATIQDRFAEVAPDLLEWFRTRAAPAPEVDDDNVCGRCGAVVGVDYHDKHKAWHESLTISMDSLAGLCITTRERFV